MSPSTAGPCCLHHSTWSLLAEARLHTRPQQREKEKQTGVLCMSITAIKPLHVCTSGLISPCLQFPPTPHAYVCLLLQTIMLSDVDKLKRHIDSSQVTFDLGGYLPYNHDDWIKLRWVRLQQGYPCTLYVWTYKPTNDGQCGSVSHDALE